MSEAEKYLRERFGREIKKYSQLEIFAIQEAMQSYADEQNKELRNRAELAEGIIEFHIKLIKELEAKLKEAKEQNKELKAKIERLEEQLMKHMIHNA